MFDQRAHQGRLSGSRRSGDAHDMSAGRQLVGALGDGVGVGSEAFDQDWRGCTLPGLFQETITAVERCACDEAKGHKLDSFSL